MFLLDWVVRLFLAPGDLVRRRLGITVEEDGGIIRSFVNMCVWGLVTVIAVVYLH